METLHIKSIGGCWCCSPIFYSLHFVCVEFVDVCMCASNGRHDLFILPHVNSSKWREKFIRIPCTISFSLKIIMHRNQINEKKKRSAKKKKRKNKQKRVPNDLKSRSNLNKFRMKKKKVHFTWCEHFPNVSECLRLRVLGGGGTLSFYGSRREFVFLSFILPILAENVRNPDWTNRKKEREHKSQDGFFFPLGLLHLVDVWMHKIHEFNSLIKQNRHKDRRQIKSFDFAFISTKRQE